MREPRRALGSLEFMAIAFNLAPGLEFAWAGGLAAGLAGRARPRTRLRGFAVTAALVVGLGVWLGGATGARAQTSLSLHDAIEMAKASPASEIAEARIAEARGGVRQAGLGINPRLFLQSEDLRPWAGDYAFETQSEDYGYLSQTFELGGKRGKRVQLAEARLRVTEAMNAAAMQQLAGRVAGAYWNAVSLLRVITLLNEDMGAVDEMVRYHRERVDAGAMRGVDLLRMEIERDRLRLSLQAAKNEAAVARLELFRQMGRTPTAVTLTDKLDESPVILPSDVATVLAERPDVRAAREALAAAEDDLRLQRANALPDVDLLGGYKRNLAANTGYGGLQIPLSLRNRNQGEIERARAGVAAARATLALLETQVRVQVEQARTSYEAQQVTIRETLPELRTHARQNLEIATEAYRIGGVDLLRFLDAERTQFEVEVSAVRMLALLRQSALQLQLAYGVQP